MSQILYRKKEEKYKEKQAQSWKYIFRISKVGIQLNGAVFNWGWTTSVPLSVTLATGISLGGNDILWENQHVK